MLLFVGLGNPTPDSENNRHNVGFKIIDSINKKFGLSKQKPKFKGLLTTGNVGDKKIYAIKPLTFMNNSGICIRELIEYFKIDPEDVIVFHDDLDINFGKIKTKFGNVMALKFRPFVVSGRVFRSSESITLWISSDENKIPLKLKANLRVGSITVELDEFKGLKNPFDIVIN